MARRYLALGPALLFACAGGNGAPPAPAAPPAPLAPTPAPPPPAPEPHFTEGNGAVVKAPIPGATAVAIRVLFYTGSSDDPPGKEGLTALTAQLMAEGGTAQLSYPEMLRALYPMAAEIGARVDVEQTVFGVTVHKDHLARVLPLLAGVLTQPRLPEADFARIKQDLRNDLEKRLRASDDENLGKELLSSMLYPPSHPYGHPVGGTLAGLAAVTLEDVRGHMARVFGRRRMLIGLGGAVDSAVEASVVAALGGVPAGEPRLASIPRVEGPRETQVLITTKPGKAVAISIGYPHDQRRGTEDFAELALVQSYFGEHRQFHGVLMSEMREKRGLNYGDYAYVEKFIQDGWSRNVRANIARRRQHFEIWIRPVDPKDAVFALRLAMYYLNRLVTQGVSEEETANTRQFLEGYTRLWDITPERRLGFALDEHFYGVEGYLDGYRRALAAMKAPDVNGAIQRNLRPFPLHIAVVAPDGEALKKALVEGARSAKDYGPVKPPEDLLRVDEDVAVLPLGIKPENVRVVPVEELFVR